MSFSGKKLAVLFLATFSASSIKKGIDSFRTESNKSIRFASHYPHSLEFRNELSQMRESGRLKPENEMWIRQSIEQASEKLNIPPALLGCLLFQESRLDHLAGIDASKATSGIGQFSYFSFYEINHHLDRFGKANVELFVDAFEHDIRPIGPSKGNLLHPASYYYIPTGVLSSAAYLNNRYLHLAGILNKKQIRYDPELLWIYAAMAYNKGTRSILSFWNEARRRGGIEAVERLTTEPVALFVSVNDAKISTRALRRIWDAEIAKSFSNELKIHVNNLKACSLTAVKGSGT